MTALKKVTILGSGTSYGVPVIGCKCETCISDNPKNKRTRSSILLTTTDDRNILVDTSPELRLQLVREGVGHIDAVIYTHMHADHTHGFDDLRIFYYKQKKPVPIFLPNFCEQELRQRFSYAFSDSEYQGVRPHLELNPFTSGRTQIAGLDFEFIMLPHGHTKSAAFRIDRFVYATDFSEFSEADVELWAGKVDNMVASGIRFGSPHPSHSLIPNTEKLFATLGVKSGVIHHLSHEVEHIQGSSLLAPNHALAYDGMVIDVSV